MLFGVRACFPQRRVPQYDATIARKGVTYKTSPTKRNKRGFKSIVTIFNKTAAGAIYETAGRKSFGSVFVRNIDRKAWGSSKGKGDMRGRVIFRAWEEDQGKAQDGVFKALEKAKDAFEFRSKVK